MNHLIDQLKEDIQNKENAIVQSAINAKKLLCFLKCKITQISNKDPF
jgi:hypothetical protein